MGYAHYTLPGETEPRGYAVETVCAHAGCEEKIDKGLGYLCYRCKKYFCDHHLTMHFDDNDEVAKFECFAGESEQICCDCADELDTQESGE